MYAYYVGKWSDIEDQSSIYLFLSKILYQDGLILVTMLLHQPGPQLKLPSWRNKSIYAISV